jgi:hypothetical protein
MFNVAVISRRILSALALATTLTACGSGNDPATPAAQVTVTVTPTPTSSPSPTESPTPRLTKVQRLMARTKMRNRHLPNGAKTLVLTGDGAEAAVKATVSRCHVEPASSFYHAANGCFVAVNAAIVSSVKNLVVNPADFYILGPANRRYNEGDGDSGIIPMNGTRLNFSTLNKSEVITGLLDFDAPAHGRLIYDPPYADSRVVWIY